MEIPIWKLREAKSSISMFGSSIVLIKLYTVEFELLWSALQSFILFKIVPLTKFGIIACDFKDKTIQLEHTSNGLMKL